MAKGRLGGDFTRHWSKPGRRYGFVAKEPVDMKFTQRRPRLSESDPFQKDAARAGLDTPAVDLYPEPKKAARGRVKKDPDLLDEEDLL